MNDNINKEVITLPPFKRLCMTIGQLPSSYLASMSYYEAVTWLVNYLEKTVIPTVNNNSEAVSELQGLFTQLQNYVNNYFDNLDVQEEINAKLDDMVETGELQEIISEYLNSKAIFGFDNVSAMKTATNLINGSYAQTLGYHSKNDHGGSLYKIRTITNDDVVDEMLIIALNDDSLIAELIIGDTVNVKQLGCYGDGIHDDTNTIQKALDNFVTVLLDKGNYLISNALNMKSYNKLIGTNIHETTLIANPIQSFNIINNVDVQYTTVSNLTIDGGIYIGGEVVDTDYAINGIFMNYTVSNDGFNKINDVEIKNCSNAGILVSKQKEAILSNIVIHNCGNGLDNSSTDCKYFNITSYWNGIANINGTNTNGDGIYFRQNSNSNKIVNCKSHSNHGYGLYCRGSYDNYVNFEAQDNSKHGIYMYNCSNNNFNSITSSTNSQENNTYNEIYMTGVHDCYIEGNTITRTVGWTSYYAQSQLKLTENCYNNKIELFCTQNTNKISAYYDMSNPTCYNDIKINNMIYGLKNILNEDILSDSNNGSGISNIFDSKNVDTNDGTLVINTTKGCQTINYAAAQKTSPNGWLGLSVMINSGFQIGNYMNAIANFINSNTTDLTCCIEARFYDDTDTQLSFQRQFGSNNQIKFNKIIPENTAKIKLSFLVLSNTLSANGVVDLYSFRAGIKSV